MYYKRMHSCLLIPLALFVSLGFPVSAEAHPHAWISVKTSVIVNDKGEAVALREHWLFDRTYSAYASADLSPHKNGKFTEADLLPLARENIQNLKEFSYFTVFEDAEGKSIKLEEAKDIASAYEKAPPSAKQKVIVYALPKGASPEKDDASARQIAMDFTVPLATPVDLRKASATYRVYDPTYYVDMAHYEHDPVSFISATDGSPVASCYAKVDLPKVDQAMIFNAAALDKNATAPKDLGYYFSEKVTLSCSPPK